MSTTTIIVIAVIVVIALLLLFLLRGRKQHVTFGDAAPLARPATPPPAAPAPKPATPVPAAPHEGRGVGAEMADAVEDVVDQFVGLDSRPKPAESPADTLTKLKGLGPKAAARLQELGVSRFDQIAAWTEQDVATIDAQLGAFKGRIGRDRWVEQARLLAKGDTDAFEAEFGKLGG